MMKVGSKVGVSSIVLVVVVFIAVFLYKRQNRPVPPAPKVAQGTPTLTPPGYALLQPDALVLSQSLSQLPRDILTIPLLKDILTEDFVFYYEQNERRLSLQGTIRRIAYEHQLSFGDEILAYVFNTRASIAFWKTHDGRLGRYMLFIERGPLLKILEAVAKIVLDDKQLTVTGELRLAADVALPVYDLHYARNQHVYFVDHAGQLIVFSDAAMLLPEEAQKQAAVREFVSSPHPADRLLQHLRLEPLAGKHTLAVSARYLSFGYQRFFPSLEAIRFDYEPSGWSTLVLTAGSVPDVSALWEIAPTAPALCAALPLDMPRVAGMLRVIAQETQPQDTLQAAPPTAAVCWYRQSRLYTPLALVKTTGDPELWMHSLKTLFTQTTGGLEAGTEVTTPPPPDAAPSDMPGDTASADATSASTPSGTTGSATSATAPSDAPGATAPSDTTDSTTQKAEQPEPPMHYHPPFEVSERSCTGGKIWQREVSSRYGLHPARNSAHAAEMRSKHYFVVTLAYCHNTLLFSPDSTLVENAIAVLEKKYPPLADSFQTKSTASLIIVPTSLADLIKASVEESLPSAQEPVFRASVAQHLLPLLEKLKTYPGYTLGTPTGRGGWEPLTWDSFTTR